MEKQFYQNAIEWKKTIFFPHISFQVGKPAGDWHVEEGKPKYHLVWNTKKVRNRYKSLVAKRSVNVTLTKRYQE